MDWRPLTLMRVSFLLYIQVRPCAVDGASPDSVRTTPLWSLHYAANCFNSGAQIIFRSFIQPVFSRFFSESGSTAANLRSQADQAKLHST